MRFAAPRARHGAVALGRCCCFCWGRRPARRHGPGLRQRRQAGRARRGPSGPHRARVDPDRAGSGRGARLRRRGAGRPADSRAGRERAADPLRPVVQVSGPAAARRREGGRRPGEFRARLHAARGDALRAGDRRRLPRRGSQGAPRRDDSGAVESFRLSLRFDPIVPTRVWRWPRSFWRNPESGKVCASWPRE